ncbi:MAG TPA: ABC transporter permease [Terracidiphilus sp.]|nr:ABC transporter permease [Terracidiphilus sp.]
MNAISHFLRKLSLLFRRNRFRSELDEEMAFHREQAERDLIASGLSPQAAHTAAMRRFGNPAGLREQSHNTVAFRIETILQDLRFALRQWSKNRGFALTAIIILALGIASSVAIFAFVDAALIKPLPYKDPAQLVQLFERNGLGSRFHLSYPDYIDWKRTNKSFSSLDLFAPYGFMMKTPEGLRKTDGARVSAGFFRTLGVTPILGRDFYDGEDAAAPARTALISYSNWQKRYNGSPSVLGQRVDLDGDVYTIIGVLPRDFSFAPAEPADFWAIEKPTGGCEKNRSCHNFFGVARLKRGVTFAAAFADVKSIALQLQRQYPDDNRNRYAFMLPLTDVIVGDIRPILLTTLAGAGLLLLIASINVASLLLVRAESRRREMAVRGALGASPRRLVRQFITEGLLLAFIACILGIVAAQRAMHLLATLIPKDLIASMPYLQGFGLNPRVIAFACALALFASALFALVPMSRLRFSRISESLSEGARGSAGLTWRRFGAKLVVIELSTAMVLLVGAGLLGKSFYRLLHTDIGLQPDHIAMVRVNAPPEKYKTDKPQIALNREIVRRVAAMPGVESVGLTTSLPIEDGDGTTAFRYVGRPNNGAPKEVATRYVSPGYTATLRTTLKSGRYFTENDDLSHPKVVIVNRTLAQKYFPGEDPVGKQISFDDDKAPPILIVGEIDDIQEGQLDAAPRSAMYLPLYQDGETSFAVLVRTEQDERTIFPALEATLKSIDPGMAIYDPMTMEEKIHDAPATYLHRSSAWLVGSFALMALLLGIVGLYGVVAYSVSQRTREIGVRMALGAQRGAIYSMVMRQAGLLTGIGIALGLACSIGAALAMRTLLFGVVAWDVSTLAGVALVLAAASLAASFLPARRAASVNPTDALRAE